MWAVAGLTDAAPPAREVARVGSKVFDIDYRVNESALPLETVRMWYTVNKGATWQLYGTYEDGHSPIHFNAPTEGLYGFYFVASNSAGVSGSEPRGGTSPQRWAYVDYSPPVVQLHKPAIDRRAAQRQVVAIRWSAIDSHWPLRPVSLAYKVAPDGQWQSITRNLANTGRYDWRVPDDLEGRVLIRITVVDRGGHRAEAAVTYELTRPAADPANMDNSSPDGSPSPAGSDSGAAPNAVTRSRQLYQLAVGHLDRRESRLAKARLRDALKLDPTMAPALVDLGSLLYADGDHQASLEAYQLALRQIPELRSGLEGVARVNIALREYDLAAAYLERILRSSPKDVQTWLNLGDVAIYRGDELSAREHYHKAATLDPTATEVISRAQLRLAQLPALRARSDRKATTP